MSLKIIFPASGSAPVFSAFADGASVSLSLVVCHPVETLTGHRRIPLTNPSRSAKPSGTVLMGHRKRTLLQDAFPANIASAFLYRRDMPDFEQIALTLPTCSRSRLILRVAFSLATYTANVNAILLPNIIALTLRSKQIRTVPNLRAMPV